MSKWNNIEQYVDSPEWWRAFLYAATGSIVVYLVNVLLFEFSPGNWWGLTYGTIASLLMVGVALLGVRRRLMKKAATKNLGRSSVWLQFHLYGGSLCMLMVFMHTGFTIPNGMLDFWLWVFSVWVTLSGLLGVLIQKTIPRMLASGLDIEVVYERIPELIRQTREKAEAIIAQCSDPVKEFYMRNVAGSLIAPEPNLIYYIDITGGIQERMRQFSYLRNVLPSDEREKLDTLEDIFKNKLQMDAHFTLQRALQWWLYLHLPVSLILLSLLAIHLYAVFYY